MFDLDKDFIKFEQIGDDKYYGYTPNPTSNTQTNIWSIRKVSGTGSSYDVQWSSGVKLSYTSRWEDKEDYFTYDGSQSLDFGWKIQESYQYSWWYITGPNPTDAEGFDQLFESEPEETGTEWDRNINWTSSSGKPSYLPGASFSWQINTFLDIETSGVYLFNTKSDDGNELWIDDQLITSFYGGRGVNTPGDTSDEIYLSTGTHSLMYRMQQGGGGSGAILSWQRPGDATFSVIPSRYFILYPQNRPTTQGGYNITFEWDRVPGYDNYYISIYNERGRLVNERGIEIYNRFSEIYTEIIGGPSSDTIFYKFKSPVGITYSAKLEVKSPMGTLSEDTTFNY